MKIAGANSLKRLLITVSSDTRERARGKRSGSCLSLGTGRGTAERRGQPRFYNSCRFRRTRYTTASKLLDGRMCVHCVKSINEKDYGRSACTSVISLSFFLARGKERKEMAKKRVSIARKKGRRETSACKSARRYRDGETVRSD